MRLPRRAGPEPCSPRSRDEGQGQGPAKALIGAGLEMNANGTNQGTSGNLSVRCGDAFLITLSGVPYESL